MASGIRVPPVATLLKLGQAKILPTCRAELAGHFVQYVGHAIYLAGGRVPTVMHATNRLHALTCVDIEDSATVMRFRRVS